MTEEKHPVMQSIMDRAYDKFKPTMDLVEFFDSLDDLEKKVVAVGNLNYQVGNGGFSQYWYNGYAHRAAKKAALEFLEGIKGHDDVLGAVAVVKLAFSVLPNSSPRDFGELTNRTEDRLHWLDTLYYMFDEALLDAVEDYLVKTQVPAG